ncbi:DUF3253 domain-containing protein [Actinoplanes sp. NPDC051859]|uniref:DUF3253 domain-containing protein n=1 Tax=Actinoplanes sp. NPDC051859 TaxID=3363909 RepID=UPI0037AD4C01
MSAGGGGTRTADGRYLIVSGRRLRAADPAIPESLRRELVSELSDARQQAVTDPDVARHRLQDAEVALGERGEPWWKPTPAGQRKRLAAAMCALLRHRRPDATICPSDAARVVGGESWRDLMDAAREVGAELSRDGVLAVRQRGAAVDIAVSVGPVRLARGPHW